MPDANGNMTTEEYWDGLEEREAAAVPYEDIGRIFDEVMRHIPAPKDEAPKFAAARVRMIKSIDDMVARGISPMPPS